MKPEDFEAFKEAWLDYPSQDNEGYVPDRGGFKCGWFTALEWERSRRIPHFDRVISNRMDELLLELSATPWWRLFKQYDLIRRLEFVAGLKPEDFPRLP